MRVNIDTLFFSDPRISRLSCLNKEHLFLTQGRLLSIWHNCYLRRSEFVTISEIEILAHWEGEPGAFKNALVLSMLAEEFGEMPGMIRIKGVSDRIEFIKKQAVKGKTGGQAKAKHMLSQCLPDAKQVLSTCLPNAKPMPSNGLAYSLSLSLSDKKNTLTSVLPFRDEFAEPQPDVCTPRQLLELWNAKPNFAKSRLTPKREAKARVRLTEANGLAYWGSVVDKIAASDFCNGKTGSWKADFEWLLKPDVHVKVLEGKYDNRGFGGNGKQTTSQTIEHNQF